MEWQVRTTTRADHDAVLELVRRAFVGPGRDGGDEVAIVQETWKRDAAPEGMDLVAIDRGDVIGYALGARGRLSSWEVIGLAPLCVHPRRQGAGIGRSLVRALLERADEDGWPLVVVLGSVEYYGRLGFEPASRSRIRYCPVGDDNPHFQVRRLSAYRPMIHGDFVYCWEA